MLMSDNLELTSDFIIELMNSFREGLNSMITQKSILQSNEIKKMFDSKYRKLCKTNNISTHRKNIVNRCYVEYVNQGKIEPDGLFDTITTSVGVRGASGILEVTTALTGEGNTCAYNCRFCPNETKANGAKHNMSRSYLSTEGVFKAGRREQFDPFRLVLHRLIELETLGHVIDKIEWIIIGGTFHTYPKEYRNNYLSEGWRAFNLFKHFSQRFQGRYALTIRQWVLDNGLQKSLCDIPNWNDILNQLNHEYPKSSIILYQTDNENSICARCIGVSIETRPDQICRLALIELRNYGVTHIQLGLQSMNDRVLKINNRGHKSTAVKKAVKQCLNAGFKVHLHLMIDLPGSTPADDIDYLKQVLMGNECQPDYCKIYFCLNVPYSDIRKWYNNYLTFDRKLADHIHSMMTESDNFSYNDLINYCGLDENGTPKLVWKPYAEYDREGFNLVSEQAMLMVQPWTRTVRVQRDFCQDQESNPSQTLIDKPMEDKQLGYVSRNIKTNEQQIIMKRLIDKNIFPIDIRSREIGNNIINDLFNNQLKVVTYEYENADGREYYISLEYLKNKENPLVTVNDMYNSYTLGHVRVRIPNRHNAVMLPDIYNSKHTKTAIVRELHIYGTNIGVSKIKAQQYSSGQHKGFGSFLMNMAEQVASLNNCNYIVVISGVGVRGFYRKLGYTLTPTNYYMSKHIHPNTTDNGQLDTQINLNNYDVGLSLRYRDFKANSVKSIFSLQSVSLFLKLVIILLSPIVLLLPVFLWLL